MKTMIVMLGDPASVARQCEAALQVADACLNHFAGVWVIRSPHDEKWWLERLLAVANDPEFQFAVMRVSVHRTEGVLPDEVWRWLDQHGA